MVSLDRVFQLLAEHTTDLVCIHDADNAIRFATPSAKSILGYDPDALVGRKLTDFLSEDFINEMDFSTLMRFFNNPETRIRFQVRHNDNRLRWLETTFTILDDDLDAQYRTLSSTRDITESVHLTDDLMNALAKEQELSRFKSNLYSIASHEFKTPLAVIQANIEMLKVRRDEKMVSNAMTSIEEEIDRLNNMIINMLELKKLTAGETTYRPEEIDLQQLINDVVSESVRKVYPSINLVLETDGEPYPINADYTLLRFVFSNLLSNACKFSNQKGNVELQIKYDEEEVELRIKDYGIGIPEDEHKHVFNSFYRAKNAGNIQGTGVGLAIVKEFVDLHQGTVEINSTPGKGSTFTVRLKRKSNQYKLS